MKDSIFLKVFGEIDDELIAEAAREWKEETISKRRAGQLAACAVMVLLLSAALLNYKDVRAAWEKFTTKIGEMFGIRNDITEYTNKIEKSVTKNGVTITLKEAVTDGENLWIVYSARREKGGDSLPLIINNVWVNEAEVGESQEMYSEGLRRDSNWEETQICCFRFDESLIKSDFVNIKVVFKTMEIETEKILGEFLFNFDISLEKLKSATLELTLDETVRTESGGELKLAKFRYNAFDSTIKGYFYNMEGGNDYFLKGQDSLGNQVQYRIRNYNNPEIEFVLDTSLLGHAQISPEAEYLTLQLYELTPDNRKTPIYYEATEINEEYGEEDAGCVYEEGESPADGADAVGEAFRIKLK